MTKTKWFILLSVLAVGTAVVALYIRAKKEFDALVDDLFDDPGNWGI